LHPQIDRVRSSCVNLDSARQSQISEKHSERARPLLNSKASEEERFGEVAASLNSHNLSGRGIRYEDIELPKNTGMGIYISIFAFLFGFAIVWHIFWLICLSIIGV